LPAFLEEMPEPQEFFASSKRIDAIISSVYKLSRGQASKLISEEIVFINSRVVTKESTTLKDGDVVSVRHYGKFIFDGEIKETKKGRLVIQARVYK
jgi:RNA-binding protein YlmH